ncbi:MAG: hypothetical protein FJ025_00805 [Chloroflexi bacterium]|nr:hypothetical protein [Chloroflexota bacterium]
MTTTPIPAPALPAPQPEQPAVVRTWRPKTAGILNIIAGVIVIIVGAGISTLLTEGARLIQTFAFFGIDITPYIIAAVTVAVVFGIVTIIGGIFSIRRIAYGMALAGSILAILAGVTFFLGIPALIFVAEAKKEFA